MPEVSVEHTRALDLVNALWNDKDIGATLQARAKEKFPEVKTNLELYAPLVEPLRAEAETIKKELEALRAERAEEKRVAAEDRQKSTLTESLTAARAKYALTEEGFDQMVARMKDTGNYSDAEAAAAWVASNTAPKVLNKPSWADHDMNMFGSKKNSANKEMQAFLNSDPLGYADAQFAEFAADPEKFTAETPQFMRDVLGTRF